MGEVVGEIQGACAGGNGEGYGAEERMEDLRKQEYTRRGPCRTRVQETSKMFWGVGHRRGGGGEGGAAALQAQAGGQ